ncbi:hypothetical protein SSTU70S_03465 [Stutzerimonas stutzeri]
MKNIDSSVTITATARPRVMPPSAKPMTITCGETGETSSSSMERWNLVLKKLETTLLYELVITDIMISPGTM